MDLKNQEKIKGVELAPSAPKRELTPKKEVAPEAGAAPAEKEAAAVPKIAPVPAAPPRAVQPTPAKKNETLVQVENILAADLDETYQSMRPELQRKFKAEGERVAGLIWQMLTTAKVQAKKILELVVRWLKMIPGVNRYFLEQESKIKTDQILDLSKKERE